MKRQPKLKLIFQSQFPLYASRSKQHANPAAYQENHVPSIQQCAPDANNSTSNYLEKHSRKKLHLKVLNFELKIKVNRDVKLTSSGRLTLGSDKKLHENINSDSVNE